MKTREGEANFCRISSDPKAEFLITTFELLRDVESLEDVEPNGLAADISEEKSPFCSTQQGSLRMILAAQQAEYSLDIIHFPSGDDLGDLLVRVKHERVISLTFGKAARQELLKDWIIEILDWVDRPTRKPRIPSSYPRKRIGFCSNLGNYLG